MRTAGIARCSRGKFLRKFLPASLALPETGHATAFSSKRLASAQALCACGPGTAFLGLPLMVDYRGREKLARALSCFPIASGLKFSREVGSLGLGSFLTSL